MAAQRVGRVLATNARAMRAQYHPSQTRFFAALHPLNEPVIGTGVNPTCGGPL